MCLVSKFCENTELILGHKGVKDKREKVKLNFWDRGMGREMNFIGELDIWDHIQFFIFFIFFL
ncbi:hypothetical protein Hanom_Chr14g01272731 [Helianthus anomalus]